MKSLYTGEGESATLRQNIVKVASIALGAAIGFAITKEWTGAIFGAGIALAIEDSIDEPVVKKAAAFAGFVYLGYIIGGLRGKAGIGALTGALVGTAFSMENNETQSAWKQLGLFFGKSIADGLIQMVNDVIILINGAIRGINKIPGSNIPTIGKIPFLSPPPGEGFTNPSPKVNESVSPYGYSYGRSFSQNLPVPTASQVRSVMGNDPRNYPGEGGWNPAGIGSPADTGWDYYQGPDLGSSRGSGVTVVQMVIDKKVLGELAIDELGRVVEFQGGLNHGASYG